MMGKLCSVLVLAVLFLANIAAAEDPIEELERKAAIHSQRREYVKAEELLGEILRRDASVASACYWRGRTRFCEGKIAESLADFDQYVKLQPNSESRQWERGIACYYAKEYARGAKQFELYQSYHDQDVENSTWRYLCVARDKDVETARKTLLPISADTRVPMMQIFAMYQGEGSPEKVMEAVKQGKPGEDELRGRLFYAHLYIGLWHEAAGRTQEAAKHIFEAEKQKIGHYMWDVAHVHADLLRKEVKE